MPSNRMPPIEYVYENDYMTTSQLDTMYGQQLNENSTISPVIISEKVGLCETASNKLMPTETHVYKIPNNGELVPYTVSSDGEIYSVIATDIPKHLIGWKAKNLSSNEFEKFDYNVLTQEVITTYSDENTISLYGDWESPRLIRVIAFIPFSVGSINCSYISSLTAGSSYTVKSSDAYYSLSKNYKQVVDNSDENFKYAVECYHVHECAIGDGCLKNINAVYYPTYFAIKDGDYVNFELTLDSGEYVPVYEMVTNQQSPKEKMVEYHFYSSYALRCNLNGFEKNATINSFSAPVKDGNNKTHWFSSQSIGVRDDLTLIVPLRIKPFVNVCAHPGTNGFYAYIGKTTIAPAQQVQTGNFMPNETCTVYTYSMDGNAVFTGWYINGENGGFASSENPYTFKVGYNVNIIARWNTQAQPTNPPIIEISYLLWGQSQENSLYYNSNTVQYSVDNNSWITLPNTTPITLDTSNNIILRAPLNVTGNLGTPFIFAGYMEYFRNDRNPVNDTPLSSGTFAQGGNYLSEDITSPFIGNILELSSLSENSTYKIYAVYKKLDN